MTPIAVTVNCDDIFGNWIRTSLQTRSHRRRDSTKLFVLQYIRGLLKTVGDCRELISHRRRGQDKTASSYPRLRCELGIRDTGLFHSTQPVVS